MKNLWTIGNDAGYQSDAISSNLGSGATSTSNNDSSQPVGSEFKKYVSSFGPETARDMAKVVSQEASRLIEMQTVALFGDYRLLQREMEVSTVLSEEGLILACPPGHYLNFHKKSN